MMRYRVSTTAPGEKRPWSIDPDALSQPWPELVEGPWPEPVEDLCPEPVEGRVTSTDITVMSVSAPQDAQKRPSGTVVWQVGQVTFQQVPIVDWLRARAL